MIYTIHQIQQACRGKLISGDPSKNVLGFCIDSRIFKKGQAFIAIRGKSQDGHTYIPQVLKKGAALIIADHVVKTGTTPLLIVKDTTKALGEIARMHRLQFQIPVIVLTGSAGKTTTKEMIAAVLSKKYKVLKNYKNENNWYGVPLTLLKLNASHQIVVLEMGTNQPGDMVWMSYVAQADVAVLINVGESHLEKLKTPAGVYREKIQILKHLSRNGMAIFNNDDEYWKKMRVSLRARRAKQSLTEIAASPPRFVADPRDDMRFMSYGLSADSDVKASHISGDAKQRLTFRVNRHTFQIRSPFQHNVSNALAAIACGKLFKIPTSDIQNALAKFKFEGGRQDIQKIKGVIVINDTYNSNPVSFRSAVQTLDALNIKGKKILVCADMKELGPKAVQLHKAMADVIRKTSINIVFSYGDLAKCITAALPKSSFRIQHFDDFDRLGQSLKTYFRPGNAILIKGSRSMKMERVVEFLENI